MFTEIETEKRKKIISLIISLIILVISCLVIWLNLWVNFKSDLLSSFWIWNKNLEENKQKEELKKILDSDKSASANIWKELDLETDVIKMKINKEIVELEVVSNKNKDEETPPPPPPFFMPNK